MAKRLKIVHDDNSAFHFIVRNPTKEDLINYPDTVAVIEDHNGPEHAHFLDRADCAKIIRALAKRMV